jgi:hypothetical protein
MSGTEGTFFSWLRGAEIDVVREQLDTLASLRYRTGLLAAEGHRYQELCRTERALLHPVGPS